MGNPFSTELLEKTKKHPCYSFEAHHKHARMHLPVAPHCNVSCNYCNRKFDCVNESRPGVTSEVLTPDMAKQKYDWVKGKLDNLSVVGIAGPGDALANWEQTKRSIQLIRAADSEIIFCLSTNGLMLPEYAAEMIELGVRHVTVTMNCIDPAVGAQIYKHVYYKGKKYEGIQGAQILLSNQLEGIKMLTSAGVLVKVNIVMVRGVNDRQIPDVVKKAKELGAFITNIMPLIPAPGSVFENFPQTSMKEINEMRNTCEIDMQQMRHCKQCRADAIGLLGDDVSQDFRMCVQKNCEPPAKPNFARQYKIAVTSKYGKLVDQHFGHAERFLVYTVDGRNVGFAESRSVQKYCLGMAQCDKEQERRDEIIQSISDCDAVLTMRIGESAKNRLAAAGIESVEYCYTIESGLLNAMDQLALKEAKQRKEAI